MTRFQRYLSEFNGSGGSDLGSENTSRKDEEDEMFYNEGEDIEIPETDNQHNTFRRQTEQGAVSTYDKDMNSDLKEDIGSSSPGRSQTGLQPSTEDLELEQFGGSGTNTDLEKESLDLSEGELKMYKQYLSTIVEDLVRNDKTINVKDCIKIVKELDLMSERDCQEFLKENLEIVFNEGLDPKVEKAIKAYMKRRKMYDRRVLGATALAVGGYGTYKYLKSKKVKEAAENQSGKSTPKARKQVAHESTNFKQKVSDHIAPSPENKEHMKRDARPTSKYSKQKREVDKMIGGIKKKFREQVSYSIIQSLKDNKIKK